MPEKIIGSKAVSEPHKNIVNDDSQSQITMKKNDNQNGAGERNGRNNLQGKPIKKKRTPEEKIRDKRRQAMLWTVKITAVTFFLTAFFSFLTEITASRSSVIISVFLLFFMLITGIVFDGVAVAVTSCDLAPLNAMAARKIKGSKHAVLLVNNAEKVANICSDVIGDIFGIVSGACLAAIALRLAVNEPADKAITIALSSLLAALTVGGKSYGKTIAINSNKEFMMFVGRVLESFTEFFKKKPKI